MRRHPTGGHGPAQRQPVEGHLPSVVVLCGGVWLIVASFLLDHRGTGVPLQARRNDLIVGGIIAVVALTRILTTYRARSFPMISTLLGLWLIAAPFVLGYNQQFHAAAVTWNNILVGFIVVMLAGVSWFAATSRRREDADEAHLEPARPPRITDKP